MRLYGILLHSWNESFFKLCVFDCGRFIRTDCCSSEKERLDYVRVLVVTPSLDIISMTEKLVIDGVLIEVKIVEEWGFSIGEDACLFEDSDGHNGQSDNEDVHVDPDVCKNVDTLVGKIVEYLEDSEVNGDADNVSIESLKSDGGLVDTSLGEPHMVSSSPCVASSREDIDQTIEVVEVNPKHASPDVHIDDYIARTQA